MKSCQNLPMNAKQIELASSQYRRIFRRGYKGHPVQNQERYIVARKTDGSTWVLATGSGAMFWMQRWYEIPKIVFDRAEEIDKFVERL